MKAHLQILPAILGISLLLACNQKTTTPTATEITDSKKQIAAMLDSFNVAAANADYIRYFNFYTEDATFNGTDATENWDKAAYMIWAKPFFDKKTTWNFTAIKRNIYFGKNADIAWFEELLNTQMKICRGSGVVVKQGNDWKVQQYVLSTTIPNSQLDTVIKIKTQEEDSLISKLSGK
ncbi:MAG: nuclear transport factor 2 family protein [Chitinophagaceae bacterium]|nr:nuclear transport factor 2 family protein [Chitinophagaceae bacterium]MBK8786089.1 nuclear transport factor 2 family protein [Chitinophagaceae bacterium]